MTLLKKPFFGQSTAEQSFYQGFRCIICNNSSLLPGTVPRMHIHTLNLYNYCVQKVQLSSLYYRWEIKDTENLHLKTQPNKPQSLSNLMVPQILDCKSVVSVTHFPLVIVSSSSFLLDAIFFLFNSIHSEDQWLVTYSLSKNVFVYIFEWWFNRIWSSRLNFSLSTLKYYSFGC